MYYTQTATYNAVCVSVVVSLCLFGGFFPAHIRFGPTNNRLALDKKNIEKVKIIYDSLFSIDSEIYFAFFNASYGTILLMCSCAHISISFNFLSALHFAQTG